MDKVFICSPYKGNPKKNLENAIGYCRMADIYSKLPIAPHVYFTRVFPEEGWRGRVTGMCWGKDLMKQCKEIWIFCNELTEGMIEEIEEAKKLGLNMKFYNTDREEITHANYLIHTELGPAYRRIIAESYGDRFYVEGGYGKCSTCKGAGTGKSAEGKTTSGVVCPQTLTDPERGWQGWRSDQKGRPVPLGTYERRAMKILRRVENFLRTKEKQKKNIIC